MTRSRWWTGAGSSARGSPQHSSEVLGQLIGKRSDEVKAMLPDGAEEAIHRDRFVLT